MYIIRTPKSSNLYTDLTLPIGSFGRVIEILRGTPEMMGASAYIFPYMLQVGDIVRQSLHAKHRIYAQSGGSFTEYLSITLHNVTKNYSGFTPTYWRTNSTNKKPFCRIQEIKSGS